jgi:hypothetical protein
VLGALYARRNSEQFWFNALQSNVTISSPQ